MGATVACGRRQHDTQRRVRQGPPAPPPAPSSVEAVTSSGLGRCLPRSRQPARRLPARRGPGGAAVPLLGDLRTGRGMLLWRCRQGLVGRHYPLAQLLGWGQRAVAPVRGLIRTLGGGLEPGHRPRRSNQSAARAPAGSHHAGRECPGAPGRIAAPPRRCRRRRRARLRPIHASPPFQARQGPGATFVTGANDNLLRPLIRYSRSAGERRRCASRARSSAAAAP
jgi:hypothetical protein